jgi:sugar phosphate isomerase/epimerase
MPVVSRREFGTIVMAGVPLAAYGRPTPVAAAGSLTLGVTTSSFRELPRVTGHDNVDDVLRALRTVGVADVELALANVEPAPPSVAPFMGGSQAYPRLIVLTPEQIAATNAQARAGLRAWRLRTNTEPFDGVRARFAAAGIAVHACAVAYDDSFTDEEIDATFRQVKALGVTTVASPLTMAMAVRLQPFAERHGVAVAIHNQVDDHAGGAIGTGVLADALALSPVFRVKLDIGNVTASNRDAVAEVGTYRRRLSHVVIRDRLRNGGRSQPLGEGDTPIGAVLNTLRASGPSVPVFVEYDYIGLLPAVDEVSVSLDYLKRAAG